MLRTSTVNIDATLNTHSPEHTPFLATRVVLAPSSLHSNHSWIAGATMTEYSTPGLVANSNHPVAPALPRNGATTAASALALAAALASVTVDTEIVAFFGQGESSLHGSPASDKTFTPVTS